MATLIESIKAFAMGLLGTIFGFWLSERKSQRERRRRFRDTLAPILDEFHRTAGEGIAALHGKYREIVRSEGAKIKEDIRRSKRAEFDNALNEFLSLRSDDFAPRHDLKGYPGDPSGLLNPIFDAKGKTCRLLKVIIDCAR